MTLRILRSVFSIPTLIMHLTTADCNSASYGEESAADGADADGSDQGLIIEATFR
jgi:hypothetical protein